MNISALENIVSSVPGQKKPTPEEAMRQTAQQFEAILLMQLTSALNGTGEQDEDSLFGGDGGTDMAKKMFSEQMATTISQSGGVGLADIIMQQLSGGKTNPAAAASGKTNNLSNVLAAVKDIKETKELKPLRAEAKFAPLPNRSVNSSTLDNGMPANDLEIISTVGDESPFVSDNSSFPMTLNEKPLNTTRPRIVPDYAVSNANRASLNSGMPILAPGEKVEFQMPVIGRISSNFGTRFHPVDRKMKFHGGIDIAVPKGTSIGAAADGVVKFAGWKGGYGYAVIIEHPDGTETLYGHNQKLLVEEGQTVSAGDPISLSGSTGKSTGPHLHFEVRENGHAVNPNKYLSNVLPRNADRQE